MGLFSNKKKVEIETVVLRVIEDSMIPDTGIKALSQAMASDVSISESYREAMSNSVAVKVGRMYKWAEANYHYKVPKSNLLTTLQGEDIVKDVIQNEIGTSISIEYFEYSPFNSLHMGWESLINYHGYNTATNELTNLSTEKGVPVFLYDMKAVYTQETFSEADPGTLAQWGSPATNGFSFDRLAQSINSIGEYRNQSHYIVDSNALVDYVEVTYTYKEDEEVKQGKFTLPMMMYEAYDEYYHVKYTYTDKETQEIKTGYWSYLDGSKVNSVIDDIYTTEYTEIGSFLPNIYFQLLGENLARKEEKWYRPHIDSTKLCNYLGFDYSKLGADINAQSGDQEYEQIYMTMGVPFNTKNKTELLYLFKYFSTMYYVDKGKKGIDAKYSSFTKRKGRTISISDSVYKTTLAYQGIERKRIAGKIGPVGVVTTGKRELEQLEPYESRNGLTTKIVNKLVSTPCKYFRLQVNETFYEEIAVYGASFTYHVYDKYHTIATGTDSKLLIPLDYSISSSLSSKQREELYSRSFHNVFNKKTITEKKWYTSSVFKAIIMVVAVVIAVVSWGGLSGISASLAGLATATVGTLALMAIKFIAFSMLVRFGTQFVVSKLGAKMGFLAAIFVVAASIYFGGSSDPGAMNWGDTLLSVGNGLMDASNTAISEMANGLDEMMNDFMLVVSQEQKELQEAQKLLGSNININPYDFVGKQPIFIDGEQPNDYFRRTVESGNIGMLGIEGQRYYVENALALPTFTETINMVINDEERNA